jgi:hypothetical protein
MEREGFAERPALARDGSAERPLVEREGFAERPSVERRLLPSARPWRATASAERIPLARMTVWP